MWRPRLPRIGGPFTRCTHSATTSSLDQLKQKIPPAIKRTPTDLLSALASTVGKDPTAPHFQFIDDPATIPTTIANKRSYFMAKEMGKRAARQLATEWPTLFAFDRDEPRLEAFRPMDKPDPLQMEKTEESLLRLIEDRAVKDACRLYEAMLEEGKDVSERAKDRLFQLAAFYNSNDVPFAELEEWAGLRNLGLSESKQWINAGMADILFESLPRSTVRTSIMIAGLAKHASSQSIKRAKQLFEELEKNDASSIPSRTFAALMSRESYPEARVLLTKMIRAGTRPDESVWNALLTATNTIASYKEKIVALRGIMGEMTALGDKASLRVYGSLLEGLASFEETDRDEDKNKKTKLALSVLVEVLDELSTRDTIEILSAKDSVFYCTAMKIARRAGNLPIGQRIAELYESKKNHVKLAALSDEGVFYSSYVSLCSAHLNPIEEFAKMYMDHVPRVVGMTRSLAQLIFQRLEATPHFALLRRAIEDCVASRLLTDNFVSSDIRAALLKTSFESLSPDDRVVFSSLVNRLVSVWIEFSQFTDPRQQRMQYKLAPGPTSDMAVLLMRIGEREKAWRLLDVINDEDNAKGENATVVGHGSAKPVALTELLDDALRRKNAEDCAICLELLAKTKTPKGRLTQVAEKIIQRCALTPAQSRILTGFVRLRPE